MRTRLITSTLALGVTLFVTPALAAKPVDSSGLPFGNGFPSGSHFNLNIIGKKADFACPAAEYNLEGNQVYGGVIFFPRVQGDDPITILMESGAKGPRGATTTAQLEVTDWCTQSFPDFDAAQGDGAALRLPASANGYAVYARITGKPGSDGEPTVTFKQGGFEYVQDEAGNDLILVGKVESDGTVTTYRDEEITINRTSSTSKGVRKATNLTGMFEWSGLVCSVPTDLTLTDTTLCCGTDEVGNYVNCSLPVEGVCPVDTVEVQATCNEYTDEWVFNIADFVGYLWDLDTTGTYTVQVRFYPIP